LLCNNHVYNIYYNIDNIKPFIIAFFLIYD
jgi:hypothetical protein